ncbi:MAG: HNH endonuclease [Methanocorpusculum sp.]|nr:HNH endonuclease [Methanocorpusculum sp.]
MVRKNPRADYEVLARFRTGVWAVQPESGQIYVPGERRMLKARENNHGYLTISVPPQSSCYPLSRAVWIGATLTVPVFDDLEVDHINGNIKDNRFKNLRLLTHAGNERCNRKQITFEQAEEIRREYEKGGVTLKELAERFGRGASSVRRIIRGEAFAVKRDKQQPKESRCGHLPDDKQRYGVFKELCLEGKQAETVMNKYRITRETLRSIIEEQSLRAERGKEEPAAGQGTEAEAVV